jgi:hypothetical protein
MPDTGAPWAIPYVDQSDLVRDFPSADLAQATAIAAGLTSADSVIRQVFQVMTTTDFTTTSTTAVDLTDVTVTVVPQDAANRIAMLFTASSSANNANREVAFQFRRDTTDLFENVQTVLTAANIRNTSAMMFDEVAGDTASRSYSIRTFLAGGGGTLTVANSSLIVMEYVP